jgi:hypothetical protein
MATVLGDVRNVRRSRWPSISGAELEERTCALAETNGHQIARRYPTLLVSAHAGQHIRRSAEAC